MRILARNFNIYNFKCCYFLQFHRSSILSKNSCRSFCKFILENGKTTNLQIQRDQQLDHSSSFSTFHRLSQTPHNDELLKHRGDVSIAKLSTAKEHSNKQITLGIETLKYMEKRELILLMIKIRHNHNKKNENKWIHLYKTAHYVNYDFPTIAVKDAYLLVKAMDLLMNKLGEHEHNHPTINKRIKGSLSYHYILEISQHKKYGNLEFVMVAIEKQTQKLTAIYFPIGLLSSLRERMAKLLVEFDGTNQIEPPPSTLPKWMLDAVNKIAEDANKLQYALLYRDTFLYKVDEKPQNRKIIIEYKTGSTGTEFVRIVQTFDKLMDIGNGQNLYFNFAKIPIQDIPFLLDAMRTMSNELYKQPQICQNNKSSIICHPLVEGIHYDYKLEIHSTENKQKDFRMQTLINADKKHLHVPIKLYGPVPMNVFNWLQEQMAEILLVSSSSSASNKLGQPLDIVDEKQGTESISNSESNYQGKEILCVKKLPFIRYYKGKPVTMFVYIEMHQSKHSRKWIYLYQWLHFTEHKFARIFVSDDAYLVIKAMDELMNKIIELDKPPNYAIFVKDTEGLKYNYKFGIRPNPKQNGRLEFRMESITTVADPSHKPKKLFVPIRLLPSLREEMAKMLTEFDGTQQIGPLPSALPKWMENEEINPSDMPDSNANEDDNRKWEILRAEQLDFNIYVNSSIGKQDRKMIIRLQRNKWGQEFIQIVQEFDKQLESTNFGEDKSLFIHFPPIPVKIAYYLLEEMHKLSNDSDKKCTALKISDEILAKTDPINVKHLDICQRRVNGIYYDYKLSINISHITKQLDFKLEIKTKADQSHDPKKLYQPISMHVFKWLKEKMAELLKSSSNQQKQNRHHIEQLEYNENANDIGNGHTNTS